MSPDVRGLAAALVALIVGGTLNMIALRRGWTSRFNWPAAVVSPIAVGLFVYWSARSAS
jgi:hypothetical protein